ncbi:hypothetical protein [Sphaerisporangium perillae]|uniref:hypothetical protein n=1 Tax=Sphaerisporangium perillae TaxID=2935860 RepID=UPI00200BED98|nr:hypothetical protein [Sphaerisporangium perillae]
MANTRIRIAALVAIPLILGACGGDPPDAGVASGGNGAGSPTSSADLAKYASCLREHGLTVVERDDGLSVRGPDPRTGQAAEEACKQYAPNLPEMPADEKKKLMDQALKFAVCMREHGVNMPDPQQDAKGGIKQELPTGMDKDAPVVRAAQEACRPLMIQEAR